MVNHVVISDGIAAPARDQNGWDLRVTDRPWPVCLVDRLSPRSPEQKRLGKQEKKTKSPQAKS